MNSHAGRSYRVPKAFKKLFTKPYKRRGTTNLTEPRYIRKFEMKYFKLVEHLKKSFTYFPGQTYGL